MDMLVINVISFSIPSTMIWVKKSTRDWR